MAKLSLPRVRKRADYSVVAIFSDPHCGHRLGLMKPATMLSLPGDIEGGTYQPEMTKTQEYIYSVYAAHINQVFEMAAGQPVHVVLNGDPIQGNKHKSALVSDVDAHQVQIAHQAFEPWFRQNTASFRLIAGTGAHEFGNASATVMLADMLQTQFPNVDVAARRHSLIEYGGVTFDISHHGPYPGSRTWLKGNVARYYLRDRIYQEIDDGIEPAAVYARAHYHSFVWEILIPNRQHHLIITPSYSGLTDHARQATRSAYKLVNGLCAFVVEAGRIVETRPMVEVLDVRERESL